MAKIHTIMKILALETATNFAGMAVIGDGVFSEYIFPGSRENGDSLILFIDRLLKDARINLKDIDLLAVGLGPGLYTGLRVGLSVMKGLALSLSKPLIGISTMDTLAYNFLGREEKVLILLHAYGGEAYAAIYEVKVKICRQGQFKVGPIEAILKGLSDKIIVAGPGIKVYRQNIEGQLGKRAVISAEEYWIARPGSLARLAEGRFEKGHLPHPDSILPLYLKKSEAEINWKRRRSKN